jgi:hypothetical protein
LILNSIIPAGITLTITGIATTVYSGTIGVFTALNAAANQPAQVQDAGLAAATQVNRRFRMTSGAALNAIAWGLAAVAADTERVSQFITTASGSGTAAVPANGNTYVVETLDTLVGGISIIYNGGGSILIQDITFTSGASSTYSVINGNALNAVRFVGNRWTATSNTFRESLCTFVGCSYSGLSLSFGRYIVNGVALTGTGNNFFSVFLGGDVSNSVAACLQGTRLSLSGGTYTVLQSIGLFDVVGGVGVLVDAVTDLYINVSTAIIWRTGGTIVTGMQVISGGKVVYQVKPTLTGATQDVLLGGTALAWAAIPAINAANNAAIVLRA